MNATRLRTTAYCAVLEVVYLIFNEGYAATAGDGWLRRGLCEEALRLARVLTSLAPDEPEVHGLAALLEIQASRLRARLGPAGEPILLVDQDRAQWDQLLIHRGLLGDRIPPALTLTMLTPGARLGPYEIVAFIVHRGLEPGNMMLTKKRARLLDFGLAKARRLGQREFHPLMRSTSSRQREYNETHMDDHRRQRCSWPPQMVPVALWPARDASAS